MQNTCFYILLLSWIPLSVATLKGNSYNTEITLPGCQSKCGHITVPYPFGIGIGAGCSIDPQFDINCDTSFNPAKAFITVLNLEVFDILETKIRIRNRIGSSCYNQNGSMSGASALYIYLENTPFSLSNENKFMLLGCDDFTIVEDMGSCAVMCSDKRDLSDGFCSGIGCCENSIPKGRKTFSSGIETFGSHSKVWYFNPCGYSFLGEKDKYNFRVSDLSDPAFINRTEESVPLLLEWAIGNQTCDQARGSGNFACRENSFCNDTYTGLGGYRCSCSKGYQGNPYLNQGCQDIDECENNPCGGNGICTNTPGGYFCSCREGYQGDGLSCLPKQSTKLLVFTGLGTGFGLLLLLAVSFWLCKALKKRRKNKRKEKFFQRNGGRLLEQQILTDEGLSEKTRLFTAKELEKATDHFNESRVIGQGGQGTVYKGMLSDGTIVAVKKSKLVDESQLGQFINEIVILSQINHRNIVKLLGCCLETEVPMLVYQFIPNGNLSEHIHDEYAEFPITWDMRLRIAAEVAGALAYLHYAVSVPIYHRDIKSSNILLDEKYKAKISDFGISRFVAGDATHVTTLVQGTFGYLDPEYFQTSQFTDKSDVYSFGVVLVELLSRQKPISSNANSGSQRGLATRFLISMEENRLHEILDPKILEQGGYEQLCGVANLAYRCLNLNGKERPTMREAAVELDNIRFTERTTEIQRNFQVISTEVETEVLSEQDFTDTSGDTNPLLYDTD